LQRAHGFTLIEIMVAMAIFALVVAAIYSSWTAIVKAAETGKKAAAAVQRSRIAIRTIEDALLSARSFEAGQEYYSFVAENGSQATLSFVSRLSQSFPRSGRFGDFDVRRVTFSLEPGPDYGEELVLRQNPVLMEMDVDEKEHPLVLAKNVKEFEMKFWDGKSRDWLDEWTETNQLPALVQIALRWGGDNTRSRSSQAEHEIIRLVALPSATVKSGWQMPGAQGRPGLGGRP
jgi:general secretion pathway protein J